jgi:putative transposase
MRELTLRKIRFILRHSRKEDLSDRQIWKLMKINKTTYYRILRKYANVPDVYSIRLHNREEKKQGRNPKPVPYEHVNKVIEYRIKFKANANRIRSLLSRNENICLSHHIVYKILRSADMVKRQKNKKKKRNSWVRFERKHSLSLWQTDWTKLGDKWLIVFLDDASRLVVGWGLFEHATSDNSVKVLKEAIGRHGRPLAVLTGHDAQFYYNDTKDGREQGETVFQKFLAANGIKHVLARVNHPQTCGKIERFFGEVKTRFKWKDFDNVPELVEWHNTLKPHMSLDLDNLETPVQAFGRKMHHRRRVIRSYVEV